MLQGSLQLIILLTKNVFALKDCPKWIFAFKRSYPQSQRNLFRSTLLKLPFLTDLSKLLQDERGKF